ncbi:MAG: DUF2508 family protein [Oscillospiraceae bacterium]|nr:DUF2508 family protein [Oscillospiraceae bacterium]
METIIKSILSVFPAAKEEAIREKEISPTLDLQIQNAKELLEQAYERFNLETDMDRIDSHIYQMQALESRINLLYHEAKKEAVACLSGKEDAI